MQSLFYNIEIIQEAIQKKKQIQFDYYKYGVNKKLHLTGTYTVSPYQLILRNQRYYLMELNHSKYHRVGYLRVDRMGEITLSEEPAQDIHEIPGYENGINYKQLTTGLPYMFSDDLQ